MFNPDEYRQPEPPEGRPQKKLELFYEQPFKIQYFIFLKYTKNRSRSLVKKYMFMGSDHTYYKYNQKIRNFFKEIFEK